MNNKQLAAFAALLTFASGGALARGANDLTKWYVGLDYGEAQLDRDDDVPGLTNRDDSSDTFAIRVGYRFTSYFALEAGYADIGHFSSTFIPSCGPGATCPSYDSKSSIDGFLVSSLFTWPIAKHFSLRGSLGGTYRNLESTIIYPGSTVNFSEDDWIFSFGAGIGIPINDQLEIDLDYTHYREIGLALNLNYDVGVVDNAESSLVTLGVRFRF